MTQVIEMPWDWPVDVNYLEAKAFCNWKSERTGLSIRLPTEAEWYCLREAIATDLPDWDPGTAVDSDEQVVIQQVWEEIRRFMMNYVGIVRTYRRLKRAHRRVKLVQEEVYQYYWDFKVTGDLIELRNLAMVAEMVVISALRRQESRGLHYTLDFPHSDDRFIRDTIVQRQL